MNQDLVISTRLVDRPDGEQPGPWQFPIDVDWKNLEAMLKALYDSTQTSVDVRYTDEEGDQVIISSQDELNEAIRLCGETENVLQLYVRGIVSDPLTSPHDDYTACLSEMSDTTRTQSGPQVCSVMPEDQVVMVPGAFSGANAVAIEMPDCPVAEDKDSDKHRTEVAEMAETGEVAPRSKRDAETGYWMISKKDVQKKKSVRKRYIEHNETQQMVEKLMTSSKKKNPKHDIDQEKCLSPPQETSLDMNVSENMSYSAFVRFMNKLKEELRTEIVHDVTRKTVRQVLRGLEAAQMGGASPVAHSQPHQKHLNEWPIYIHEGILCDNCEKTIIGPRYKCGNCLNYDLCEDCESRAGVHDENHVFVKLRRPCYAAGYRNGKRAVLLKHRVYPSKIIEEVSELEIVKDKQQGEINLEKLARKAERLRRMEVKVKEKLVRKEEKLKRKYERLGIQAKEQLLPQLKKERIDLPFGVLGADFVCDVTVPDGMLVLPGQHLTKIWRVCNSGTLPWGDCTKLQEMWSSLPAVESEVKVPSLAPGLEVDITVELIAPSHPGKYESHWRLNSGGQVFGHNLYCIVEVDLQEDGDQDTPVQLFNTETPSETAKTTLEMKATSDKQKDLSNKDETLESKMECLALRGDVKDKELVQDADADEEEEVNQVLKETTYPQGEGKESFLQEDDIVCRSASGRKDLFSFEIVDVERPERPKRPPPEMIRPTLDEDDFWNNRSHDEGPSSPNNTPLDMSFPPESTCLIMEPEILLNLSTETESMLNHETELSLIGERDDETDEESDQSACSLTQEAQRVQLLPTTDMILPRDAVFDQAAANDDVEHDDTSSLKTSQDAEQLLLKQQAAVREVSPTSSTSSVEVVSGEELADVEQLETTSHSNVSDFMLHRTLFPPHGWYREVDDMESLSSLSEDDSSLDEDFFIVQLPDCFDTSKPLVRISADSYSPFSTNNAEEGGKLQAEVQQTPLLDELLQASESIPNSTLIPTMAQPVILTNADIAGTHSQQTGVMDKSSEILAAVPNGDNMECNGTVSLEDKILYDNDNSGKSTVTEEQSSTDIAGVTTEIISDSANKDMEHSEQIAAEAGAGLSYDDLPFLSESQELGRHANHLMQSAVAVASKAAARAFTTAKDVFYNLQAKQSEWKSSSWKPPQSTWQPPKSEWKPPQSQWKPPVNTWKPPADDYKPPSDEWMPPTDCKPPADGWESSVDTELKRVINGEGETGHPRSSDSGPMKRLLEMGFYNRALNQELLDKHQGDLESVIQDLLQELDNDWAHTRH